MAIRNTLEAKITYRIKRSKACMFLRDDFAELGGYDQVGRVLRGIIQKGLLIKIGYGLYARTKKSSLTGKVIPEKSLQALAREAMEKLGVELDLTLADKEYNEGVSTQVPTGRLMKINGRFSRKIGYNGRSISYEARP